MNVGGTIRMNRTGYLILLILGLLFFYYMLPTTKDINTDAKLEQINLRDLLAVAIEAARDGGKEVVAIRDNIKIESKGKTKEGANDSVTTADFKSHCTMMRRLRHSFPTVEIISEESKTVCSEHDLTSNFNYSKLMNLNLNNEWVNVNDVKVWIDPLDATQEYTEKLYNYVTTMVCVAVQGRPIIGVIHKPFKGETSWTWAGQTLSPNLMNLKERQKDKLTFIVSRSHTGKVKEIIEKMFNDRAVEIVSAGGAGYKALEVAVGRADVYMHVTNIKKWDICAGNAILDSLGGRMTTKDNKLINYDNSDDPVNTDGLVATLNDHEFYLSGL